MKVNGNNRLFGVNPYQKNNPPVEKTQKTSMGRDQLQISPEALEKLKESKSPEALEHGARIEELKKQVQSGEYQVDSKKLAEKMYDQLIKGYL